MQSKRCFNLLQGSCPFSSSLFFFFFLFFFLCGFVSSLNPSGEILSLVPTRGLCLWWPITIEAGPSRLTYVL